jgi:hypothetical protein
MRAPVAFVICHGSPVPGHRVVPAPLPPPQQAGGSKYEGEWLGDKRHGRGTQWVRRDGKLRKQYTGDWEMDKKHVRYGCERGKKVQRALLFADAAPPCARRRRMRALAAPSGHCNSFCC